MSKTSERELGFAVYLICNHCERREMEVERIRGYLDANECGIADTIDRAEFVILVACGMKVEDSSAMIQTALQTRPPGARVLVYGCFSSICENIATPEVTYIPLQKAYLFDRFIGGRVPFASIELPRVVARGRRSETVLNYRDPRLALPQCEDVYSVQISEGCAGSCTYCIIRSATGPQQSRCIEEIVSDFERGLSEGFIFFRFRCENLGLYGCDIGTNVGELLEAVGEIKPHFAVDLPDFHPEGFVRHFDEVMRFAERKKVYLMHLPVQSGSQPILDMMNRKYSIAEVSTRLGVFRKHHAATKVGTDIIAGFPSETEDDFDCSYRLMKRFGFDWIYLHVFQPKPGTIANLLEPKVPESVALARVMRAFKNIPHIACYLNDYDLQSTP